MYHLSIATPIVNYNIRWLTITVVPALASELVRHFHFSDHRESYGTSYILFKHGCFIIPTLTF